MWNRTRAWFVARTPALFVAALVTFTSISGTALYSNAVLTDSKPLTGDSFTTTTLQAPLGLTVTQSGSALQLTWTATSSSWADGYQVSRASSSSGPYTLIATVPGATTTNYTDSAAPAGTSYYQVVAYRVNWNSTNIQASGTVATALPASDTFSGSGALGSTETGALPWQFVNSTAANWSRSGGYATTATSMSSNPMALVNAGTGDVAATLSPMTSASYDGESIYFRVVDGTNWVRLWLRDQHSVNSQPIYTCDSGKTGFNPSRISFIGTATSAADATSKANAQYPGGMPWNCYANGTQTTTSDVWYLTLDRDVNGSTTNLANYNLSGGKPASIKVNAKGSTISMYAGGTLQGTYTDSTNLTAPLTGVGYSSGAYTSTPASVDSISFAQAA